MSSGFDEFVSDARDQGVSLDPTLHAGIQEWLSLEKSNNFLDSGAPHWAAGAIVVLAEFLRDRRGAPTNKPFVPQRLENHTATRSLNAILAAGSLPLSERPTLHGRSFISAPRHSKFIHMCCKAEAGFARAYYAAAQEAQEHRGYTVGYQTGFNVIFDGDGREPLFLQKMYNNVRSALTLRDGITVGGVPYPDGTLVELGFKENRRPKLSGNGILTSQSSDLAYVNPLRLTMYSLRPDERPVHWFAERTRANPRSPALEFDFCGLTTQMISNVASLAVRSLREI